MAKSSLELGKTQAELEGLRAIRQQPPLHEGWNWTTRKWGSTQLQTDPVAGPELAACTALKELVRNIQDKTDEPAGTRRW